MPPGDEARVVQCANFVLELVDNLIVISGDVLDAELVVFQGVRERSVPARRRRRGRVFGRGGGVWAAPGTIDATRRPQRKRGRRATRELQKPPVLEDEAACLQSSVAAHERGAVDV